MACAYYMLMLLISFKVLTELDKSKQNVWNAFYSTETRPRTLSTQTATLPSNIPLVVRDQPIRTSCMSISFVYKCLTGIFSVTWKSNHKWLNCKPKDKFLNPGLLHLCHRLTLLWLLIQKDTHSRT